MVNSISFGLILFVVISTDAKNISAKNSLDDLKKIFMETILECSRDYPITTHDVMALKNKILPNNDSIKCLLACVYKKTGMMNDNGELHVEGVNAMTRRYLSEYPDMIQRAELFTAACKGVNDAIVGDGEMGCERAALIFKCTVQRAPEFDFV